MKKDIKVSVLCDSCLTCEHLSIKTKTIPIMNTGQTEKMHYCEHLARCKSLVIEYIEKTIGDEVNDP